MSCHPSRFARHGAAIAALAATIFVLPAWPAAARGPENIADVAEQVIDAVVNISTSQKVDARMSAMPDLPPGMDVAGAVLVVTPRGLRYHGGASDEASASPDAAAVGRGLSNVDQHVSNLRLLGIEPVVVANRFPGDTEDELGLLKRFCAERNLAYAESTAFVDGAAGAEAVAARVVEVCARGGHCRPLYPAGTPVEQVLDLVVRRIYGGAGVTVAEAAQEDLRVLNRIGETEGPVCVAKTPLSLSDDPTVKGRPTGFTPNVRRFSRSAGAGFTVAYLGEIQTMPGLPRRPLAEQIDLTTEGRVVGLL